MKIWAIMTLFVTFLVPRGQAFDGVHTFESAGMKLKVEKLIEGLDVIWGFDFLPDGRIILTEKEGRLKLWDPKSKKLDSLTGAPNIDADGQGGLLDIALHPEFAKNSMVYLTYSSPQKGGVTTAVGRGRLTQSGLADFKEIFVAHPTASASHHFGSRLAFDQQGHLFVTVGDRGSRDQAQRLDNHLGKVLRLRDDGGVPKDNPFIGTKNAKPEIWSYGHRNPQGLTFDKKGQLWEQEHGPRGGDEINLVQPGKNYGWPVITYGREYYGPTIGDGSKKDGMEQPVKYYVPSIAPSGLTFYNGRKLGGWNGSLFSGALKLTHINRLSWKNGKIQEERLLSDLNMRVRCIRVGLDGYLYFSVDQGKLFRIVQ